MPTPDFPTRLQVTEQSIDISGLTPIQKNYYHELFSQIVEKYQSGGKARYILGITGPTGAGKSVIATLLKELSRPTALPFALENLTIDAYHFPNEYLLTHDIDGKPLKNIKGRYDTYDVPALIADLQAFADGQNLFFPIYSRKLHDPVPNSISIQQPETLLIVEGLWLLYDQAGWEKVRPLLDFTYFIDSDKERAKAPVIQRHLNGGRTLAEATRHYEEVDGRNFDLVVTTRWRADQILPPYYAI